MGDGLNRNRGNRSPMAAQNGGLKMHTPFIPRRTRAELAAPAPPGQRHQQMKDIILPLLGSGLTPEAVFTQLRSMYDSDVSDKEIRDLIA
jgi:hypothetical protein